MFLHIQSLMVTLAFFQSFDIQNLPNLIPRPAFFLDSLTNRTIPSYIQNQSLHASFLENIWGDLAFLLCLLVLLVVVCIVCWILSCFRNENESDRLPHLKMVLVHLISARFASMSNDILTYAWIDLFSPFPEGVEKTTWDIVSRVLAIICSCGVILFLAFSICVSISKSNTNEFLSFAKDWKFSHLIFCGIKNDPSFFARHFYPIYLLIEIAYSLFSILERWLWQASAVTNIVIGVITLLIMMKNPFRENRNLVQFIMNESSYIILGIAACLKNEEIFEVFLFCRNLIMSVILIVFLFVKLFKEISAILDYKESQGERAAGLVWLQLLVPIAQQFLSFGFEGFKLTLPETSSPLARSLIQGPPVDPPRQTTANAYWQRSLIPPQVVQMTVFSNSAQR